MTVSKRTSSLGSLIVPFILWPIVFGPLANYFWQSLSIATAILLSISVAINKTIRLGASLRWIIFGGISGVLLYGFFFAGFQLTKGFPVFSGGISSVYGLRGSTPPLLISILLFFPIGTGEEIYWRGLIQKTLGEGAGSSYAWILQAAPYTLIHLFTLNPPLLITALIGGLAWGFLYRISGSITPSIFSHVIFDLLIFVVLPFS